MTAAKIDDEIMRIMKECYERAVSFLKENKEVMDKIAKFLYEKETISTINFSTFYF